MKIPTAPLPGSPGDLWSTAGLVQAPSDLWTCPQGLGSLSGAPAPSIDSSPAATSWSLSALCSAPSAQIRGCCSRCKHSPVLQQEHTALTKLSVEIKQGWEGNSSCRTNPRHLQPHSKGALSWLCASCSKQHSVGLFGCCQRSL